MNITLAYGRDGLAVELPGTSRVVRSRFVPGVTDERAVIRAALRHPIGLAPLAANETSTSPLSMARARGSWWISRKALSAH